MKKLINRWNSPTPTFWLKVQKIGIVAGSLGVVLIAPPFGMAVFGGYLIASGSIISVLSQLTIK